MFMIDNLSAPQSQLAFASTCPSQHVRYLNFLSMQASINASLSLIPPSSVALAQAALAHGVGLLPDSLASALEQYRNTASYTDSAAFLKLWLPAMLVHDVTAQASEGIAKATITAAANQALAVYGAKQLSKCAQSRQVPL